MTLFNKKNQTEETRDILIIFDNDNKTSDIVDVDYITDGIITVDGLYKVPIADCEVTVGQYGRNFFYRAPERSITEVERLAQLEKQLVLTQITAYEPPTLPTGMDMHKWLLYGLVFLAFITVMVIG